MNILQKMTCLKPPNMVLDLTIPRAGYSTVTAMLEIVNKWFHNIDIGQLNGVVLLDLKKAFDTLDHEILLT